MPKRLVRIAPRSFGLNRPQKKARPARRQASLKAVDSSKNTLLPKMLENLAKAHKKTKTKLDLFGLVSSGAQKKLVHLLYHTLPRNQKLCLISRNELKES